jgi:hypothetical protein
VGRISGSRRISWSVVAALAALALAGCGSNTTIVKTVVETTSTTTAAPTATVAPQSSHRQPAPATRTSPAQVSNPLATAGYRACDAQIAAKIATTTCGFAENTFHEYWVSGQSASLDVYSPTTAITYRTQCTPGDGQVVCTTADDGSVKFSQDALDRYSQSQADHYAKTHDLGPAPGASTTAPSTPDYSAPSTPDYSVPSTPNSNAPSDSGPNPGNEIPNYPNGTGSVVQCADGMYSHSGGRPGACSGHGGLG